MAPALGVRPRRGQNKPRMRQHSFYCSDDLWTEVLAQAAANRENVADVIRDALERYVKRK
jgi:hypothetical protein